MKDTHVNLKLKQNLHSRTHMKINRSRTSTKYSVQSFTSSLANQQFISYHGIKIPPLIVEYITN